MKTKLFLFFTLLACGPACLAAPPTHVTVNSAPLQGNASGPFSLDFVLTDGGGTGDGNTTITLSNFNFGGGSATGVPTLTGGASGSLSGPVVLSDNVFFTEFTQGFAPGSTLSFDLTTSGGVDAGNFPDGFAFSILDSTGAAISTADPTGANALLALDFNVADPPVQTFSATGAFAAVGTPTADRMGAASVPEPGTWAALAVGGLLLAGRRVRRRV